MNRIITSFVLVMLTLNVIAQVPQKFSYQAVVRDADNKLVVNQEVGLKISILKNSANGTAVYAETQTPTTNINGLISIEIGGGTAENGNFAEINWANGNFFVKTEIDPTGGTNYTITGTTPILSVPYALHAKSAESFSGEFEETDPSLPDGNNAGDMLYWNGSEWVMIPATQAEGATLKMVNGQPAWVAVAVEVGEVTNPATGKTWMDRNLGASQVATAKDDAAAYGDLYQWGRSADGHQVRTSAVSTELSATDQPGHGNFITVSSMPYDWRSTPNDNLWQGVNGVNNPCPVGYRLPTNAEFDAERESWSSNNANGAFASPLKLTVGGNRGNSDGSLGNVDGYGYYWTSTAVDGKGGSLTFYNGNAFVDSDFRAYGFSVRCIKE